MQEENQESKINKSILRKQRRKNKIIKTKQRTMQNKILKDRYKKAKRNFNHSTKDNCQTLFQNCFSRISQLKQKGIINTKKMSRLHSKIYAKFTTVKNSN